MGLRSPQELEQVQVGVTNLPSVSAAKTAAVDLATPANNFLQQKALNDQIESVKGTVALRKNALAKISSKYAVDSVTSEIKARMAALEGNNAIKESDSLYKEALRELDGIEDKAPEHLKAQVRSDKKGKVLELQTLMTNKINTEGKKAAIKSGEAITKMYTMEAASSFLDIDKFKEEYNNTYDFASNTERMKGSSDDDRVFSSGVIASNSAVEGVKFSLSQVSTPDKVDEIEKYYNDVVLQDGDIHVNSADQTKINNAFTKARDKAEGDLGYYLAKEARTKSLSPTEAEKFIFDNARGSGKAATMGVNLYNAEERAVKAETDKNDREFMGQAVKAIKSGNPGAAVKISKNMSPEAELKARNYLDELEGGNANAYTNPKDREFWSKLVATDKDAASKLDLDKLQLSRDDRRSAEAAQQVIGKDIQEKNFKLDSGALEKNAEDTAMNISTQRLGLRVKINPKMNSQIKANARDILYNVRAEHPNEKNGAVIMGYVRERMLDADKGVLKDVSTPNFIGNFLSDKFGVDPNSSPWLLNEEVVARPRSEFDSERQTGGQNTPRVPDPTESEVSDWQSQMKKVGGQVVDKATAKKQIIQLRLQKLNQAK